MISLDNIKIPDILKKNKSTKKYDRKAHFIPTSVDLELGYRCQCSHCKSDRENKKHQKVLLNRKRTEEIVFDMLCDIITHKSVMTKGGLIKYVRKHFKYDTVYSDVGRVANKLVKLHTGRTGIWKIATTARFIRRTNNES